MGKRKSKEEIAEHIKTARVRSWTFTLNLSECKTPEDACPISLSLKTAVETSYISRVKYMQWGIETAPSTGMIHLQGWITFNIGFTLNMVRQLPMLSKAHLEPMYGNLDQNKTYVAKEGFTFEIGNKPRQGSRTDLTKAKKIIDEGGTPYDVAQEDFGLFLRYERGLNSYAMELIRQRDYGKPEVIVRFGPPGTGKTRFVYDNFQPKDIYSWPGGNWWNGYLGQPYALLDDFDGSVIEYRAFLRILDRYKIDLPTKGNFTPWRPKAIIITSNRSPNEWYPNMAIDLGAIMRRIDKIIYCARQPDRRFTEHRIKHDPDDPKWWNPWAQYVVESDDDNADN